MPPLSDVIKYVIWKLVKQGEGSNKGDICLYRSDGKCCAAGFLISDSNYQSSFEHKSAGVPDVSKAITISGLVDVDVLTNKCIVEELQRAHDRATKSCGDFVLVFLENICECVLTEEIYAEVRQFTNLLYKMREIEIELDSIKENN